MRHLSVWFCDGCQRSGAVLVTPDTAAMQTLKDIHVEHLRRKRGCKSGDEKIRIIATVELPDPK